MRPFVKLNCLACDNVVTVYDARVIRYSEDDAWIGYRCPVCKDDGVADLPEPYLEFAVNTLKLPVIDMPTLDMSTEPALTEDDLIAFGRALEGAQEISL